MVVVRAGGISVSVIVLVFGQTMCPYPLRGVDIDSRELRGLGLGVSVSVRVSVRVTG